MEQGCFNEPQHQITPKKHSLGCLLQRPYYSGLLLAKLFNVLMGTKVVGGDDRPEFASMLRLLRHETSPRPVLD